jgi:predicted phage baseplate assembly protein
MSTSLDPTLSDLNDCGCCEGISAETPARVFNRPGLSAIAYRAGAHAQFKETMLARLSASRQAALDGLNTRDDDDFSIALLDAWATVADVLTFYQERIANESYLRTATERLSALELARLIGYELRPGVAAGTYLAFTLEDAPGAFGQAINLSNLAQAVPEAPPPITIDAGVKAQSVPGPGEQPATFETVEAIEARVEWNALKPRLQQPQNLSKDMGSVVFQGTATSLKPGDKLLIDASDGRRVRTVFKVTANDEAKTTRVDFETPGLAPPAYQRPAGLPKGAPADFPAQTTLNETTAQAIINKQWSEEDLSALAKMQNWPVASLVANINKQATSGKFTGGNGVFAFRQRAAIFGYNAPNYDLLVASLRAGEDNQSNVVTAFRAMLQATTPRLDISSVGANVSSLPGVLANNWEDRTLEQDSDPSGNMRKVDLDNAYPGIAKEGWLVLSAPFGATTREETFKVRDHAEIARSAYTVSGKTSRLSVEAAQPFNADFKIRTTAALAQSESLPLAQTPIEDVAQGDNITLDRAYLGLKKGRRIIITGERDDFRGVTVSELLTIKEVIIEKGFTVLIFETALVNRYVRSTVTINANVARSTHGETAQETLGGGDASQAFQRFTLRQPPLTYTSAATPSGGQTTLEVRVNDLLWHEVPELFGHGPDERIYITRTDDEGKTTVLFGDGKTGARLPTGAENVKAKYRRGLGLPGLVKEHKLSQLMTRPLGVKGVTNPLAATGAQDREQLSDARRNAPLTVLTLGRVVSLLDYEDFTRAFSGIAKALATWSWSGERRSVLVTVAGMNGAAVTKESDLYKNLLSALRQFGDPHASLLVESYEPRFFRLAATLQIEPDYLPEKVRAEVEALLRERFSFDARDFGQPVHQSEVIGLIQNVPGVASVAVREFYRSDLAVSIEPRLAAARPQLGGDKLFAAELLTLDPRPLQLEVTQ